MKYLALARCTWPRAWWVVGSGPWAVVACCRPGVLSVELYAGRLAAERQMDQIGSSGCGGACNLHTAEVRGTHRLVHLAGMHTAGTVDAGVRA